MVAQALGKRTKTDPIDAAVIAHFVEATKPEPRPLPEARLPSDLVARRRQIVEMMAAEGQRERRISDKRLRKRIARLRKALEKQLAELDGEIDDHVRGSPVWAEKEDLLASVPGIGPVVARALIAEMPELGMLEAQDRSSGRSLRPGPDSPASGAAGISSAAAAMRCVACSSSPPWSRAGITRYSSGSATA